MTYAFWFEGEHEMGEVADIFSKFIAKKEVVAPKIFVDSPSPQPAAKPTTFNDSLSVEELVGNMEVRVQNPNDFSVDVTLRSEGKAKNFSVDPNGSNSVRVPNGRYEIFFKYSSDPDGLYQGDSFTLNNNGIEIRIVKVINGNYGIRKVK
jgi:hypothetical protein